LWIAGAILPPSREQSVVNFIVSLFVDFFLGIVVDSLVDIYGRLRPNRKATSGEPERRRGPRASQTSNKATTPPG
jgi:hypothetical protein